MKAPGFFFSFIVLFFLFSCYRSGQDALVPGEVVKLTGGLTFSEGPAADKEGNVFFTDIPVNKIHQWTTGNKLKLFRDSTGAANGLFFDGDGHLIACEGGNRQVTSISMAGEKTVLTERYQGKRYNRPNDLWIDPKGGVYFSDPAYGVDSSLLEMDVEGVYYLNPSRDQVIRVCDDLVRPNGIIGTKDGKSLYVTDHYGKQTWRYAIQPDGSLTEKTPFVGMGCDGLTTDERGNVYLTNMDDHTIDVYSPEADLQLRIPLPERPTNICFGGEKHNTLFITTVTSLYSITMNVQGN
jgi:gluconolactonase